MNGGSKACDGSAADHYVRHIYDQLGAQTRASTALFGIQQDFPK